MKILSVMAVFAVLLLAGCAAEGNYQSSSSGSSGGTSQQSGRAVYTMTDAAADMGAVTSVKVTVDSVRARSEAGSWVDLSSSRQTYDLLQLKAEGKQAVMADAALWEGNYNEVRLGISKVVVTDSEGDHEAKLPSNELKIKGEFTVKANSTAVAVFDFQADESLHTTGQGEYVMAPVVQLETRENAQVTVRGNEAIISGGSVRTRVKVGMDVNGNVGVGLGIPADANVTVSAGRLSIGLGSSARTRATSGNQAEVGGEVAGGIY